MANPTVELLTATHSRVQTVLANRSVRQLATLWGVLDLSDIDATQERWLGVSEKLIQRNARQSSTLAASFVRSLRSIRLPGDNTLDIPAFEPLPSEQIRTSLRVTGPVSMKAAMARGVDYEQAGLISRSRSSAAGARLILDGGRSLINQVVRDDPKCLGWARSASADACAFCLMLASRGPVYTSDTIDFQTHDACKCQPVPVYDRNDGWLNSARNFRELWDEATDGAQPGEDALKVFRNYLTLDPETLLN